MPCQNANPLALERIPDVARPIIVTTEEDTTRDGESDGGDSTENVVMGERVELAISPDIKQAAGCVI